MSKTQKTYNRRASHSLLFPPVFYRFLLRLTRQIKIFVNESRQIIENIQDGIDPRLVVIVGPCSIHDYKAAIEYAKQILIWQAKYPHLYFVMRVYLEKPRTDVGWKGLFNDPDLNDSFRMTKGIWLSRKLLIELNKMGVPVATEFLEPVFPTYLAGLVHWAAIGARTVESQIHREMASGLSMPIGMKNTCKGGLIEAINAIVAASFSHVFPGFNQWGFISRVKTTGNKTVRLILRGGDETNYDRRSIDEALERLEAKGLHPSLYVDLSHGNSKKKAINQKIACMSIARQIKHGYRGIAGVMIEGFFNNGNQPNTGDLETMEYGTSITDECLSIELTEDLLIILNDAAADGYEYRIAA